MQRFKIIYTVGQALREDVVEALDIDAAEIKANERRPTWRDIYPITMSNNEVKLCSS